MANEDSGNVGTENQRESAGENETPPVAARPSSDRPGRRMAVDMTQGAIAPELLRLAAPLMMANILHSFWRCSNIL